MLFSVNSSELSPTLKTNKQKRNKQQVCPQIFYNTLKVILCFGFWLKLSIMKTVPVKALDNRSRCCCRKRAVRPEAWRDKVASRGQAESKQARAWDQPSPRGFMLRFSSSRHWNRRITIMINKYLFLIIMRV